jgi:selenium metabolism protein YedF
MEIMDLSGKPCPIPVIEAKKALRGTPPGETVRLLVDNDISRQNLEKMAAGLGCAFSFESRDEGILVSIRAPENQPVQAPGESLVVAFGKNTMGAGDDELGAVLVKAFIYSLTELDTPPETLLFFNSGVRLTTEGSAVLKDLGTLESRGTVVSSCGTCLDFYGLRDKLAIGSVTNMYAIASSMGSAGKLINI